MGLDMYISKINKKAEGYTNLDIDLMKEKNPDLYATLKPYIAEISYPELEYIYESFYTPLASWRKANAIHGWFVQNVQEGNDDCDSYLVSRKQLQELLNNHSPHSRDFSRELGESL